MSSGLRYQTIQTSSQALIACSGSSRGATVEGAIKLGAKLVRAASEFGFSVGAQTAIEKLRPQIESSFAAFESSLGQTRNDIGVLLVIGYQEWAIENYAGDKLKSLLEVAVGGVGLNAKDVVEKYLAMPRLVHGVPRNWTRKESFCWATRFAS